MDMHSRGQYLERVREEYRNAGKKTKTRLLNEARKRTRLNRKVLIGKLAHPAAIGKKKKRGPRKRAYTREVQAALIEVWELFDYPCGQRLAPALRQEVARLRRAKELVCSDEVAAKLEAISPRSIDRLLDREKRLRGLRQNRNPSVHPLLYQKVPVKVASEWDTTEVGNLQLDYVFHCGRSTAGEYVHTLSAADIATGWWEGEAIMGRSQVATKAGMECIRQRLPFRIREIHPDNDSGMINGLLWGKRLEAQYESLNVAALHRRIEELRDRLFAATEAKNSPEPAGARRRGRGIQVVGVAQRLAQRRRWTDSQ
jgi:hypothetical protein